MVSSSRSVSFSTSSSASFGSGRGCASSASTASRRDASGVRSWCDACAVNVRSQPTTDDWASTEVYTNLIEMHMEGESPELGPIHVRLNHECLSTGLIRTPFDAEGEEQPEKACRMAVGATFQLPRLGLELFNKEPVLLTIDNVRSIPPAGNPGKGQIYQMLPLYDVANPDAEPVAYLTSLSFRMGTYLPEQDREPAAS